MAGPPPPSAGSSTRRRRAPARAAARPRRPDAGALRPGQGRPQRRRGSPTSASCRSSRSWRWPSSWSARVAEVFPRRAGRPRVTAIARVPSPGIIGTGEHQISLDDVQEPRGHARRDRPGRARSTPAWAGCRRCAPRCSTSSRSRRTQAELRPRQDPRPGDAAGPGADPGGQRRRCPASWRGSPRSCSEWLELSEGSAPLLKVLSVVVGVATSALLFWAMFVLLADRGPPAASLWPGRCWRPSRSRSSSSWPPGCSATPPASRRSRSSGSR